MAICGAMLAIYFVLVVQFNSFTQPGMVLMAIPFGLVGVAVAFGFHNQNLSMLAMVGILGFAGVVVNNSLVMVEFINRVRDANQGGQIDIVQFKKIVVEGSSLRLRPILLTTVSTVVGLLPTAYGWIGGFDSFLSPMVLAMMWGLLVGTTSILFVIPVLYSLNEWWRIRVQRVTGIFKKAT